MKGYVISGAKVADGTGRPAFAADVVVGNGLITAVLPDGFQTGDDYKVIDGGGCVLAPGFIDMHAHSDFSALALPYADSKSTQGVTTEVSGQCGFSAFPVCADSAAELLRQAAIWRVELDWQDFKGYRKRLEQAGSGINHLVFVGHGTLRSAVVDGEARALTQEETKRMLALAREAIDQGAGGISAGLIYPPGCFASTEELAALGGVAAETGRPFSFHMRAEGEHVLEALEEVITVGRRSGCRVHVSHLKVAGPANWHLIDKVIDTLRQARDSGLPITADRYPYIASHTSLSVVLPNWVKEGGDVALVERVRSKRLREKISAEVREQCPPEYWERVSLSLVEKDEYAALSGKTVREIASERRVDPVDFVLDCIANTHNGVTAMFFSMNHDNLLRVVAEPYVAIASDAAALPLDSEMITGKPHPRAFGTFPRVFARFVRENAVLPLEEAVRRMTALPAEVLGLEGRGVVREGAAADLVLFRPDEFRDASSFKDPIRAAEGLVMLMTGGVPVLVDGAFAEGRPGKVL